MSTTKAERAQHNLHRLIGVSDGVFAIAMTLLALEVRPPEGWNGTPESLAPIASALIPYAISFAAIAGYWTGHRRAFSYISRADGLVTTLNFLTLALISLLPVGVQLFVGGRGTAFTIELYLGLIAAAGLSQGLLWAYAVMTRRVDEVVKPGFALVTFLGSVVIPVATAGAVFYSIFTHGWWAVAVAAAMIFVFGALRRRLSPDR